MIDALRPRFEAGEVFNVFQTYVLSRAKTFEDFLTRCDEEVADVDGSKHIFRNQIDYLTDHSRHLIVDFVGRLRTAPRGHVEGRARDRNGHASADASMCPNTSIILSITRRNLANLVANRCRKDLSLFGYRFGD